MDPVVCAWAIDTMTATIAPGPASRGIPRGTRATFTASSPVSGWSISLEVKSSIATKKRSTPPESFKDSIEICRARRICCPKKAKAKITPKDTRDAWIAALRCALGENFDVNAKNTGIKPIGSKMTIRVAKVVSSTVTSTTEPIFMGARPLKTLPLRVCSEPTDP